MIRNYAELLEVAEAVSEFFERRSHSGGLSDADYVLWAAAEGIFEEDKQDTCDECLASCVHFIPDDEDFEGRVAEVEEYVFGYAEFVGAKTTEEEDFADKEAICQKIAGLEYAVETLARRVM